MRAFRLEPILIGALLLCAACGGSEADEKARRQSQNYYKAAYIAWSEQGDNLLAIRSLSRSVEADPTNHLAHYLLGTIRLGREEYDEAETHLRAAVELRRDGDPAGLAEAQNSLGVLLIHMRKLSEAVEVLEASAMEVLNREPWLALGNLGWAYNELGEYDKAIEVIRRALFDQPRFCVGLYRLGEAQYGKKDYTAAEASLTKAIGVPDEACGRMQESHHMLGMTYLRLEKASEANEQFSICTEIDPTSEIGVACAKAGGE